MTLRQSVTMLFGVLVLAAVLAFCTAPSYLGTTVLTPGFVLMGVLENCMHTSFAHFYEVSICLDCLLYVAIAVAMSRVLYRRLT
jgi:hypothetical protein